MTTTKEPSNKANGIRLNKYISEKGICSRREADKLIDLGQVTINGKIAEMGSQVFEEDIVKVKGKLLKAREPVVYIALNKPAGIICTTERGVRDNIVDYMDYPKRIFPIGRLDRDSEGLLFLTNDGDIVNKILRAGNNHEKEYVVTIDKPVTDSFILGMSNGVRILGTITKKCRVEKLSKYTFKIILVEGMNRQIRRMCEVFGYEVVKLKRVRIMNVKLEDLPVGSWRYLTPKEMDEINRLIRDSVKTEEASR